MQQNAGAENTVISNQIINADKNDSEESGSISNKKLADEG
jgi:hypothetical protein